MLIKTENRRPEQLTALATLLFTLFITVLTAGCSHTVKQSINERFAELAPRTVAVLPVEWGDKVDERDDEVANVFREMTNERLRTLDYSTPTLKSINKVIGGSKLDLTKPAAIARALGTDAALVIEITEWESNIVVTYAYLKVKARFSLYSKKGVKLWSAEYDTTESDITLDKESMELAIIKVYEPRVQRFINDVFSTLPKGNASAKRDSYFDWLP